LDKSFNGAEALKKIEENFQLLYSSHAPARCSQRQHMPYQLIITNVNLPIVNGYELARRLKQIKYEHRDALS